MLLRIIGRRPCGLDAWCCRRGVVRPVMGGNFGLAAGAGVARSSCQVSPRAKKASGASADARWPRGAARPTARRRSNAPWRSGTPDRARGGDVSMMNQLRTGSAHCLYLPVGSAPQRITTMPSFRKCHRSCRRRWRDRLIDSLCIIGCRWRPCPYAPLGVVQAWLTEKGRTPRLGSRVVCSRAEA